MLRPARRRGRRGRCPCPAGQSTAELALVLPVVMVLLLAVVQIGLVARDHLALHNAAREAARAAAVEPTVDVAVRAAASSSPAIDAGRLAVDLEGGRSRGEILRVQLRYRAPTDVPLVGVLIGDVALSTVAAVRVE